MKTEQKKALAEGVGTFFIVWVGCGALMVAERFPGALSPSAVPLLFGLAVAAMIYSVGHISGAHFNPAVTLAFAITRHFPKRQVPLYWCAQFLGAGLAIVSLWLVLPAGSAFGACTASVPAWQAVVWEAVLTFALMFVISGVANDTRAVGTMAGAAIGAAVMMGAWVGGPVSGAALNPARALAPALAEGRLSGLWIYFVGPAVGAVLAALFYEQIRCEAVVADGKAAQGCC